MTNCEKNWNFKISVLRFFFAGGASILQCTYRNAPSSPPNKNRSCASVKNLPVCFSSWILVTACPRIVRTMENLSRVSWAQIFTYTINQSISRLMKILINQSIDNNKKINKFTRQQKFASFSNRQWLKRNINQSINQSVLLFCTFFTLFNQ